MHFLTIGEKVRKLREQLNLKQEELQTENVTTGFINMIEADEIDITHDTAVKLAEKFNKKVKELNINLNIDETYLMRSPNEDAESHCLNKLKNNNITQSTINEIMQLSEEYDLMEIKAKTYFKLGEINLVNKNYDEACTNYVKAIKIYKAMGKNEELGYVYFRIGSCKGRSLQHDTAITYFNLSQYYSFAYDDKKIQKLCLYNLSNAYIYLNKTDLALETVEKYLTISDETDPYYYHGFNIKAQCYEAQKDYDRAISIYKSLLDKIPDNKNVVIGYIYNNLGLNYCYKNEFKESIKYFEMAEEFRNKEDKTNLSHSLIEKSFVLLKQDLNADAVKTIELGLKYAKEYNDIEYLIKGNYILADIYHKLNDTKKLENIYLNIVELLKLNKQEDRLISIYINLALMYLKQDKQALCEKYLLLAKDLK